MHERVVIIGCGYVGGAVGRVLAAEGCDCAGTTTSPQRLAEIAALGVRPVVLRLSDHDALRAALQDRQTVCLTFGAGRRGASYEDVYLRGVESVLDAARGSGAKRFVYTSSTRVYGRDDGGPVDEDSPTEPASAAGRVLLETERLLLQGAAEAGGVATILRLGGIYGPGRGPRARLARVAGTVRDDGEVFLNLIHRDDAAAALRACFERTYHGVLNCVDDTPFLRRTLYDRLLAEAGLAAVRWTTAGGPPRGKRVANDRIRRALGLRLQHPAFE